MIDDSGATIAHADILAGHVAVERWDHAARFGVLAPFLQTQIGWNEIEYGYIVTAFQAAYALGFLLMGWLIDRFAGTSPWGLLVMLFMGIIVAFRNIIRLSKTPRN